MIDELSAIVGPAHVLAEPDVVAGYVVDWTGRFRGAPSSLVVRPGSVGEVADVVRWCAASGVALVPQGGNTGLVGGSVPLAGEVVLSLRRLSALGDVEAASGQVTVGAGATLAAVQAHVASAGGWEVAVDLAARGSATIGGMVATNAGGTRVLRYGPMRSSVVGVEAVLGDGSVVSRLGGLLKDNTGYDLSGLLCGSEGTLGVVTAVRLRLVPASSFRTVALVGVRSPAAAMAVLGGVRASASSVLEAAELFFSDGVELVVEQAGVAPPPFAAPAYLLLEAASSSSDPTDALLAALQAAAVAEDVVDTAVATDSVRREELWRYREAHTEAINALGVPPHKLDVTLPLGRLAWFCDEVRSVVEAVAPEARTFLFGHAGDGNIHVNVVGPAAGDEAVDEAVLRLVASAGGSISAEHGIGTAKRAYLSLVRSDAEIAAFRRLKAALDPAGILNPNVLLP